jgi:hypothetical protein
VTQVVVPVGLKSADQVLDEAFQALGCEKLGGPSGNGWSKIGDLLRCHYRYQLKHIAKMTSTTTARSSKSINIGSFVHAAAAVHYAALLPPPFKADDGKLYCYPGWRAKLPTPTQLFDALLVAGAEMEAFGEAQRLWEGYVEKWGGRDWQPLAVEMHAGDPALHTSRYDLVVSVEDGIHDGLWIGEHKSASSSTDLDQWTLDGEILGEMWSWRKSNLDDFFGDRLRGICINVFVKKKNVDDTCFRRIWLPVNWALIDEFDKNRRYYYTTMRTCQKLNVWSRLYSGCIGRYDRCEFWDHCATLSPSYLTPIVGE